jgi:hypothetical protein
LIAIKTSVRFEAAHFEPRSWLFVVGVNVHRAGKRPVTSFTDEYLVLGHGDRSAEGLGYGIIRDSSQQQGCKYKHKMGFHGFKSE